MPLNIRRLCNIKWAMQADKADAKLVARLDDIIAAGAEATVGDVRGQLDELVRTLDEVALAERRRAG